MDDLQKNEEGHSINELDSRGIVSSLKSVSVLYVEDDEGIRDQLSRFLKRRVGTLYIATNGQEGLESWRLNQPDVVVTDIMMPVMDGLKMAEAIKQENPTVPIIVTTAFNETEFFLKAIDLGIEKYVIKPVKTEQLLVAIQKSAWGARAELEMQLASKVFESSSDAIVITDQKNIIIAVNSAFCQITGFAENEAIGQTPSILKSGRHDQAFYQEMWRSIEKDGNWSGEVWNRRKNGEIYAEWLTLNTVRNYQNEITHYVAIFADITERKQAEEHVHHLAHYDVLTDLPNRTLLQDRLSQALIKAHRHASKAAVMFIDLDRFKVINDTLGHGIGDLLLQEVADRLSNCIREGDTVSRLGGDEFVILLPELGTPDDAYTVAQKLLNSVSQPFMLKGHELHISASVGVSFYPDDGESVETLMKNADIAMYRAKEIGRNNCQFYHADMNSRSFERLAMETSIRRAIECAQFELYFQPRIAMSSRKIIGMEALIRWHHPDLGLVSPAQFIPLAEETGLILPLGEWVLRAAATQGQAWLAAGLEPLHIAVNVSARQFRQVDFVGKVEQILKETGFSPDYLELELTESTLMTHAEENINVLNKFKAMGIRIAIDDFGTGYSSLAYLKRLPVDILKIDRSFISDITEDRDDAAIAEAIISMAQSMSLRVVAEGVETLEQLDFLETRKCDEVQGFYYSPAVPAEQFARLVAEMGKGIGHS
ncbi:MAG: EAL domain-containing protein [Betaproteobacteria bacterium]|nr:EAL domain-containing protein [Betaproteobacteria bacterium]